MVLVGQFSPCFKHWAGSKRIGELPSELILRLWDSMIAGAGGIVCATFEAWLIGAIEQF